LPRGIESDYLIYLPASVPVLGCFLRFRNKFGMT